MMRRLLSITLFLLFFAVPAQAKYASIIIEAQTGTILHAENIHNHFYPASLTKLMTLYLTFEAVANGQLKMDQKLKVSKLAAQQPSSKLWLAAGDSITVQDAVQGLIVRSANDASVVLAEAISGDVQQFARLMTQRAIQLGMYKTRFSNPHGLYDARQVTTPRDMALLVRAMMLQFPQYYHYFGEKSFQFRGSTVATHNRFLKDYPGADGLKTGYINASGYNLAASAVKENVRLIGVVFGGKTANARDKNMTQLMDEGFDKAQQLIAAREEKPTRRTLAERPASRPTTKPLAMASTGYQDEIIVPETELASDSKELN